MASQRSRAAQLNIEQKADVGDAAAVVASLRAHPSDVRVQLEGCGALKLLIALPRLCHPWHHQANAADKFADEEQKNWWQHSLVEEQHHFESADPDEA